MANSGFDFSALDAYTDRLIHASRDTARMQKQFLRQQGSKLARKTKAVARAKVQQVAVSKPRYTREAGTYHKKIKRGKLWTSGGADQIRVFSNDPVAHLIEEGHWQIVNPGKGRGNGRGVRPGRGIGHAPRAGRSQVEGRQVFRDTYTAFRPQFLQDSEEMVAELVRNL